MVSLSPRVLLTFLVLLACAVGAFQFVAYQSGLELPRNSGMLWGFVFAVVIAMWVVSDSRGRPEIYRPFSFGLLVFLFWFLYLPYYTVRTRGWAVGLCMLLAFFALWQLGFLLSLAAWLVA